MGGQWLIRIEDVDLERCKEDYSVSILKDLENLGLVSDAQVTYQSKRLDIYQHYLEDVLRPICYACQCTRKQIDAFRLSTAKPRALNRPTIYPRICLHKELDWQNKDVKIRLVLPYVTSGFLDQIQGVVWDNPALSLGDVVVRRQNQLINYILACALDDGLQNVSHVMRGIDIMPMTVAQLQIIKFCQLPVPDYFYHLPLLYNTDGQKLSKQNLAQPIKTQEPAKLLYQALKLLGQPTDPEMIFAKPDEILAYAIAHWDNTPLIGKQKLATISQ